MVGCLAAGCASGSSGAITDPSASVSVPTAPPSSSAVSPKPSAVPAATFPLTGLGTSSKSAASARVMAAALSAGYGQTQPTGANLADTVYVEYSDTLRMLALYQSKSAPQIGPIAQTRPVDGPLLSFLQPGYANTGGPAGFVASWTRRPCPTSAPRTTPAPTRAPGRGSRPPPTRCASPRPPRRLRPRCSRSAARPPRSPPEHGRSTRSPFPPSPASRL